MDIGIVLGIVSALIVAALLVASLAGVARRRRGSRGEPERPGPRPGGMMPAVTVTGLRSAVAVLDVPGSDPSASAIQRLVQEAALKLFALMPDLEEVEVRSSTGVVLGSRARRPGTPKPLVAFPQYLSEPHVPSRHEANPVHQWVEEDRPIGGPVRGPSFASSTSPYSPPRKFSDRFELAASVLELITDPDDPVDVVRAILDAGARKVEPCGDLLRAGDLALVVLRTRHGAVPPGALDHAFLLIEQSGATRGLVVSPGMLPWSDIRRREISAPHVVHVGPDAIQRMADAVAVGADPLRFAEGPALASNLPGGPADLR